MVRGIYFNLAPVVRRDGRVVRTLRCDRSNPGLNPGHGTFFSVSILYSIFLIIIIMFFWLLWFLFFTIRMKDVSIN